MKIKVPHLRLSSQVPKQKIRWSQGTADKLGSQPVCFFVICSSCLLIIGEMSLEQGLLLPLSLPLGWFVSPGKMAESFVKRIPTHCTPDYQKSLGVSRFKFENGNLPPSSTAWGCKLLSFVISCYVWFQAAAVILSGMPCFRRGWLFNCVACVKKGPCSKRHRQCSGLLLFSLFLLLFLTNFTVIC